MLLICKLKNFQSANAEE